MKYIFTILLFIAVGIQTFSKWVIVISYEINKDYISKNICVNRMVTGSCCKGKCYLQKKLASDDDQQKPSGKQLNARDTQSEFFLQQFTQINFICIPLPVHYHPFYINGKCQEFIASVFQPPQLLTA